MVTLAVIGVTMGCLPVLVQAATLRAAPEAADPASALNASAFNVGICGGALAGGLLLDSVGRRPTLPVLAAALVGAVWLTPAGRPRPVRSGSGEALVARHPVG